MQKLFDALAAGKVHLTGIREPSLAHGGVRQTVPAEALQSRQWRLTEDSVVISLPSSISDTVAFGNTMLAPATGNTVVPITGAKSHQVDPRPKPTKIAVEEWLLQRVEARRDDLTPPSEEQDWNAARQHFGDGLIRDDFRPIRQRMVPREWQTPGPRKPWGQLKNSTKNPAKPPLQK